MNADRTVPVTLYRPDGSRLVNTGRGRWRREWRHSDGEWRGCPPPYALLRQNQMIEEEDDYLTASEQKSEPNYGYGVGWAFIAGIVVLVAILIWGVIA